MGLDLALKAAQAQTEKLQAELDQAKRGNETSFVGNAGAWGRSAPAAGAGQQPLAPLSQSQSYGKPLAPAGVNAAPPTSWGSGMLANLATTAARVVAGAVPLQGNAGAEGARQTAARGDNPGGHTPPPATARRQRARPGGR